VRVATRSGAAFGHLCRLTQKDLAFPDAPAANEPAALAAAAALPSPDFQGEAGVAAEQKPEPSPQQRELREIMEQDEREAEAHKRQQQQQQQPANRQERRVNGGWVAVAGETATDPPSQSSMDRAAGWGRQARVKANGLPDSLAAQGPKAPATPTKAAGGGGLGAATSSAKAAFKAAW
jgi:cell division protein FtsN